MKHIYIISLILLLSACAKNNNDLSHERKLGSLVNSLSAEDIKKLESENLSYELVSEYSDTYWVKDIAAEELEKILNKEAMQNIEAVFPKPYKNLSPMQALNELAGPNTSNNEVVPPKCSQEGLKPLAVLNTVGRSHSYSINIDLDAKLNGLLLNGEKSLNAKNATVERMVFGGGNLNLSNPNYFDRQIQGFQRLKKDTIPNENLNYYWIIQGSAIKAQLFKGSIKDFQFPVFGSYEIALVVQDQITSACSFDVVAVQVVSNPSLVNLPTLRPSLKMEAVSKFVHLDKLKSFEQNPLVNGKDTIVAVMDSGVNYNHPSLRPNVLVNHGEIPDNKIDDDLNGYVDDVVGYDFIQEDGYPFDEDGHGTHVAGIAAGADIGIARYAQILPIKTNTFKSFLQGMDYAIKMKADVINMSFGFPIEESHKSYAQLADLTRKHFQALDQANIVVVTAAGNEGIEINRGGGIPQSLNLKNQIIVASISEKDVITDYSNFGNQKVGIATYGGSRAMAVQSASIYSEQGEYFVGLMGTSMASPVVAGAVALVRQVFPRMTPSEVIDLLKATAAQNTELDGLVQNSGQLSLEILVANLMPSPLLL